MRNCEHCHTGIAEYQCLDCLSDNMDSLMCENCKNEHIEAQTDINNAQIWRLPNN